MKCVNQSKKFKEIKAWKISPLNFIVSPLIYYTHTNLQAYSPIYPSILSSQWLEPLHLYIIHLISVLKTVNYTNTVSQYIDGWPSSGRLQSMENQMCPES